MPPSIQFRTSPHRCAPTSVAVDRVLGGLRTALLLWGAVRARGERAQSTVEYALILLGAAAIALMVVSWVTGTDVIGRLFDTVFGRILRQAG